MGSWLLHLFGIYFMAGLKAMSRSSDANKMPYQNDLAIELMSDCRSKNFANYKQRKGGKLL
jgi:hypothetical protein